MIYWCWLYVWFLGLIGNRSFTLQWHQWECDCLLPADSPWLSIKNRLNSSEEDVGDLLSLGFLTVGCFGIFLSFNLAFESGKGRAISSKKDWLSLRIHEVCLDMIPENHIKNVTVLKTMHMQFQKKFDLSSMGWFGIDMIHTSER